MAKLILALAHVWVLFSAVVLLVAAGALQCHTCNDPRCSNPEPLTCSSETMCITAAILAASSENTEQQIYKSCASSSLCPATGSQTFSASEGVSSAVASAQCCNTDNCNSQTLDFPAAQTNNSLQCFSCDSRSSRCNTPLQCQGVEDSCFEASVMRGTRHVSVLGCTSANLCSPASSSVTLPLLQGFSNITIGPMCCGTSLCNRPTVKKRVFRDSNTSTTTTTSAPTTTTTSAPTTTTSATTTSTTTTTSATTTSAPTTSAPTTTTSAPTTTTNHTTNNATTFNTVCCFRLNMILLLLGLFIITFY
ncbi:spore coat protein SP96-like [Channa argus]|uniref:spore coat protein SP96-like n=1 Tax=Channa argus TaxID=215402 RepID=UPI003523046F